MTPYLHVTADLPDSGWWLVDLTDQTINQHYQGAYRRIGPFVEFYVIPRHRPTRPTYPDAGDRIIWSVPPGMEPSIAQPPNFLYALGTGARGVSEDAGLYAFSDYGTAGRKDCVVKWRRSSPATPIGSTRWTTISPWPNTFPGTRP